MAWSGGFEIQPNYRFQFFAEQGVFAELEGFYEVMPAAAAMLRVLQCVALAGLSCVVRRTT